MLSYALSVAVTAALAQAPTQQAGQSSTQQQGQQMRKLDGQWEVVYVEMDGKKIEDKNFGNVTIQNNKVTCRHDGKEKSWQLEFGPHHRIRAEETTQQAASTQTGSGQRDRHSHGVYIASQDFLCFSMNHGRDTTGGTGREPGATSSGLGSGTQGQGTGNQGTGNQGTGNQGAGAGNQGAGQGGAGSSREFGPYGSEFVLILRRSGSSQGTQR